MSDYPFEMFLLVYMIGAIVTGKNREKLSIKQLQINKYDRKI